MLESTRELKEQIARQAALVEELEQAGHKALATVARNILKGMAMTEESKEHHSYRRVRHGRGKSAIPKHHEAERAGMG